MISGCPGMPKTPELTEKRCPECGSYMTEKRSRKGEVMHLCSNETCRCRLTVETTEDAE